MKKLLKFTLIFALLFKLNFVFAQRHDDNFLTKSFYSNTDCVLKIQTMGEVVAYIGSAGSPGSPAYSVIKKDSEGNYFVENFTGKFDRENRVYNLNIVDSKISSEVSYPISKENAERLLEALKTRIKSAKSTRKMGFDGINYECGVYDEDKWIQAGSWSPIAGSTSAKLMRVLSVDDAVLSQNLNELYVDSLDIIRQP